MSFTSSAAPALLDLGPAKAKFAYWVPLRPIRPAGPCRMPRQPSQQPSARLAPPTFTVLCDHVAPAPNLRA